jgi:hypothetical protein
MTEEELQLVKFAETDSLLHAKRLRQKRERDDVRAGRRTQESMTFEPEEARKTFVLKRRCFDY